MNRYDASGRRTEHIPEREERKAPSPLPPQTAEERGGGRDEQAKKDRPVRLKKLSCVPDGLLSRLDPGRWETEDLLIMAILWLLYRESGEEELLIALAAYLFL